MTEAPFSVTQNVRQLRLAKSYLKMKMKTFEFLAFLAILSTVKAQFTEEQIESLAFIRLNPCERAIWRYVKKVVVYNRGSNWFVELAPDRN